MIVINVIENLNNVKIKMDITSLKLKKHKYNLIRLFFIKSLLYNFVLIFKKSDAERQNFENFF